MALISVHTVSTRKHPEVAELVFILSIGREYGGILGTNNTPQLKQEAAAEQTQQPSQSHLRSKMGVGEAFKELECFTRFGRLYFGPYAP